MSNLNLLISTIGEQGGTPMLIGGGVIDTILGLDVKDWDIEVYGLPLSKIEIILKDLGLTPNLVGKSFGIIKTTIDGLDIDISVPRRDNKAGVGHKGFVVELDHNMTPKEAGRRRDLTINSMYKNMLTGEIVDPFNGLDDLKAGIIKATDPATFVEDPLRVLRIMQLLPRKGKSVHPQTIALCRSIVGEFNTLPKERVFEEFKKLLLKAEKPSMGLTFLRDCGWLVHFPELNHLIGCEQNLEWHPEGDVWNHTLMVLDNAAKLRELVPDNLQLAFMFGALLHDIGKPSTTDAELRSHGHDDAGADLVPTFMGRMTNDVVLTRNVQELVRLHMRAGQLCFANAGETAWKRLHNQFRLDVLGLLSKADSAGRLGRRLDDQHAPSQMCAKFFAKFGAGKIAPLVQGRDLIAIGLKPSKEFKALLERAYELQLEEGLTKDEILKLIT